MEPYSYTEADLENLASINFTRIPTRFALIEPAELNVLVIPPVVAAFLVVLGKRLLEKAVDKFVDLLLGSDVHNSEQYFADLMRRFCEYICSFVYMTVEQARIKSKLDEATRHLRSATIQLGKARIAPKPLEYYKVLQTSESIPLALAAFEGLSDDAPEAGLVNYTIVASIELRVMSELLHLGSDLVSRNMLRKRVDEHTAYVTTNSVGIKESVRNAIRVGAIAYTGRPNTQTMFNRPATASAAEAGSPESFDWNSYIDSADYFPAPMHRLTAGFYFWMQKPSLDRRLPWEGLEEMRVVLDQTPPRPSLNWQVNNICSKLRRDQDQLTSKNIKELDEQVIAPLADVMTSWSKLAE